MADIEEGTAGKEVGIETPVGKVNIKGYHLGNVLQFLIALAVVGGVMTLIDIKADARQSVAAAAAMTKMEHDKLGASIDRGTEQQEIMNYILTLSPERRERLNMQMPEALRRRVIGRDP